MRTARKRKTAENKKGSKKRLLRGVFFLFILVMGVNLFYSTKYFRGDRKLFLVTSSKEAVYLDVFNPQVDEITSIRIPSNTEVEVARNLGKWKIGSVWELGLNEKMGGKLLAETVMKNFRATTVAWASEGNRALVKKDFRPLLSFILFSARSNLTLSDRVRLAAFCLKVKDFKRVEIDLANSSFLRIMKLKDGEEGYIITGVIPQKLLLIFADNKFAKQDVKVSITNASGNLGLVKEIGNIIEVMGAKVVLVKTLEKSETDCVIKTKDKDLGLRLSQPFACQIRIEKGEMGSDIEMEIGQGFAQRF